MTDWEKNLAQEQAMKTSATAGRSAERARFWAGLNRYLSAEAEHAHKVAREEERSEQASADDT